MRPPGHASSHNGHRPGRDRRAVPHPPHGGRSRPEGSAPRVAVVGGGIAGIAAAVALAERGVSVHLLEREQQLGGRLRGWSTTLADGSAVTMSRGFHAFFRQYYNLRALLRRADPLGRALVPMADYPLIDVDGHRDTFQKLPRTPPWNALAFALLSPTFGWRDLIGRINPVAALPLVDVSVPEVYHRLDDQDAMTFLERVRFPDAARHLAFSVFSRSFFADPRELSAAELATMFHIYFLGSAEGLVFDVTAEPFPQALWEPMRDYLTEVGVVVSTGVAVQEICPGGARRFTVRAGNNVTAVDAVVLATDVAGLQALLSGCPDVGTASWRARIARLRTTPPFLVSRLWLDRPVRPDRPGFLGTSGFGPLDNVSVLERFEGEAARWTRRTGGSVVELHAYALTSDPEQAKRRLLDELHRVYPETTAATIVDQRHELRADCPLFAPGTFADRPPVTTPDPAVVLAGDLARVDLPVALMERAATSGLLAANALLEAWKLRGHPLWTVPTRGRFAPLRAVAARFR
ncbi:MAG TPA: FAD-dependent oxidoreductase [Pseudonocardiaceae bacterium]|nr:FAD-dependent oxidoreductase [Pseudonocardiaceae bacterium]